MAPLAPLADDFDVAVVGSGPAGAAIALRLARLGHRVCVVDRTDKARAGWPPMGESLPPSVLPPLEVLGLRDRIEAAGFLRARPPLVAWGSTRPTERADVADEPGFHVDRAQFDAILLQEAVASGVEVRPAVRASTVVRTGEQWCLQPAGLGGSALRAGLLIDATGKASLAAAGRSARRLSAPTAALCGHWRWPHPGLGGTRVEAGDGAWYWGAPLDRDHAQVVAFVDPATCAGRGAARRREIYLALVAASDLLREVLAGALVGEIRVRDATAYAHPDPTAGQILRVGDAALALDPLSSQGVQSALASAIAASIVVNTMLVQPAHADLAADFYRRRHQTQVRQHVTRTRLLYAEAAHTSGAASFWESRAAGAERDAAPTALAAPGAPDASTRLRLSPEAHIVQTGVVRGDLIESEPALAHPSFEGPVAFLSGAPIGRLVETLAGAPTTAGLAESWSRRLPGELGARLLRWLWDRQVLLPADSTSAAPPLRS